MPKHPLLDRERQASCGKGHYYYVKIMNELPCIMDMDKRLIGSRFVVNNCTIHKSHRKMKMKHHRLIKILKLKFRKRTNSHLFFANGQSGQICISYGVPKVDILWGYRKNYIQYLSGDDIYAKQSARNMA